MQMDSKKAQSPTVMIIMGITGDLAAKKIIPALFNLFAKKALPQKINLVGFGRKSFSQNSFSQFIEEIISARLPHAKTELIRKFTNLWSYHQGFFDEAQAYLQLNEKLKQIEQIWQKKTNRLFYLSVPPELYENILNSIKKADLDTASGETRILVEKPFGKDLKTAEELDILLGQKFHEKQIYRIDHYLAKEMVQNIIAFRFLNDLFEHSWDNRHIEQIQIRLWETQGVEKRGNFYDNIGALRDVGQNHLLQMLALATMEEPSDITSPFSIHTKRAELLSQLRLWTREEIQQKTFRAQYNGYRQIPGVSQDSQTETYFQAFVEIQNNRWKNVPIIIESGKRMHKQVKDITIIFKHSQSPTNNYRNKIVFSMEPNESISIDLWAKKPGLEWTISKQSLEYKPETENVKIQYIAEYEKLMLDAIIGDQTLFVSTAEIKAMWKFTDPIINAWQGNFVPLEFYEPDTDQILNKTLAKTA